MPTSSDSSSKQADLNATKANTSQEETKETVMRIKRRPKVEKNFPAKELDEVKQRTREVTTKTEWNMRQGEVSIGFSTLIGGK